MCVMVCVMVCVCLLRRAHSAVLGSAHYLHSRVSPACMCASPAVPHFPQQEGGRSLQCSTPIQWPTCRATNIIRHPGPNQNRSKYSRTCLRCAAGTTLWPLALARSRQRAAAKSMGRTLAEQQQKHTTLTKTMRPHTMRKPLPFCLAPGALSSELRWALRAWERSNAGSEQRGKLNP